MSDPTGYYRHPTIHGERIVFVCEDDLWTVAASGGTARRLTAFPASATFPRLSPDGRLLAFTATDDGPPEVFVMDASGGVPRRLTFLGSTLRTVTWSPDGKRILFQSNFARPFPGDFHLHEVGHDGGPVRRIPWGPVREITWQPNGPAVVLGINCGDPARWKRYRGGTAGTLWIDRQGKDRFEPLLELPGNLAAPVWIGERIYFLSDHEGHGNLYSCTPDGRGLERHTDHEDYYVRYPSSDGRRIVYHAGADLFLYDIEARRSERVQVALHSARPERARKYVAAQKWLEDADLHPQGHSLVCTSRGAVFTFALWEGAPLRHGPVSTARQRRARWLADGKRIVYVTDEGGEEELVIAHADGAGRRRRLRARLGRIVDISVAPARDRIALTNHQNELWLIDAKTGEAEKIEQSDWLKIEGMSWSPDGRWLAYGFPTSRRTSTLHLHDAQRGRVHEITRPDFHDFAPSFDPRGEYLAFLSRRVFDPVYDEQYFDLGFPRAIVPCLIPLAKTTPSPFSAAHRAPRPPRPATPDATKASKANKTGVQPVRVDLPGIADRIVRFPLPDARYTGIRAAQGRVFLMSLPIEGSLGKTWHEFSEPAAKAKLEYWDFEQDKSETLVQGLTDFGLSMDGKTLLLRVGNRLRALPATAKSKTIPSDTKPGRESGWIDLGRLRLAVEPGSEWRQMFGEAWRLQRDNFWTPDMSQVDWKGVNDRYLPLVDRVACRSEFSDLLWEMQGELGTSHCYELGGDYRPSPEWFQGFLGADLAWDAGSKSWRIRGLPRGDSWDPKACPPLLAPSLDVRCGDEILAIAGRTLGPDLSPFECLVNQAACDVVLDIRSGRQRRRITVRTLASETALRYRDFVERNRDWVHEKSRGSVGYVHIPDMGPRGYSEFHRYYAREVDHSGLLIDVRWNGGGHVSQLLLEKLLRRRIGYDRARWHGQESYPDDAPLGPMVTLTNEYAGSDGDMFSHAFKLYGLGPLIGKRTWGGVIGIWPRQALVDGSITTQPEFASWFDDVGYGVENYGTDPDIEVHNTPADHRKGRDAQLERALEEVLQLIREKKPVVPEMPPAPRLAPPALRRQAAQGRRRTRAVTGKAGSPKKDAAKRKKKK